MFTVVFLSLLCLAPLNLGPSVDHLTTQLQLIWVELHVPLPADFSQPPHPLLQGSQCGGHYQDIVYIFIKSGLSTYLFIGTQIEVI